MRGFKRASALSAALLTLAPLSAAAQAPTATLTLAKQAYADVDYDKTRELAAEALRRGGNDRASTAELYWLWGTAAAALDRSEEAVRAFVHALAGNPELKLDRNLSPKIRAPYLEARGKLGDARGQVPLAVTLERRHDRLEIALRDSAGVAANIELGMYAPGSGNFIRKRWRAEPRQTLTKPDGAQLAFFVSVLDRFGNILLELGTPTDPHRLALMKARPDATAPRLDVERGRSGLPYYVVAGTLTTLGVAAGSVATAMYLRREDAASDWNGQACERPGLTRAEQCADVDDRRERSENLAIGFTAAGGALLIGAAVSLLVAPRDSGGPTVAVSAGPGTLVLGWKREL